MSEIQDLIVVKQLPVIYQELEQISPEIERRVSEALTLDCTEDTITEVKKVRAELNKEFTAFETRRKEIKNKIMAPYMEFDEVYGRLVSEKYVHADSALRMKITTVEDTIKARMADEVAEYYAEYAASLGISDIPFEAARLNIKRSVSVTKLKREAKEFLDRVASDIETIQSMDNSAEIMVEYKKTYNLGVAISTVKDRTKAAEQEAARLAEIQQKTIEMLQAEQKVDAVFKNAVAQAFQPAQAVEPLEEEIEVTFTVTSTKTKIRALREYMQKEGIKYE